jgi:hypothetical protein
MARRLLGALCMKPRHFALFACLVSSLNACSSAGDGGSDDGSSEAVCPLDAGARAKIESVLEDARIDASWITIQSPGYTAPVSRAFGAAIPLAEVPARFVATLIQGCSGEKTLDASCEPPEGAKSSLMACSQFACEADGTLIARVSLDALPVSMPAARSPGDVVVTAFDHETQYAALDTGRVAIAWSTDIGLDTELGEAITIKATGDAEVHGPIPTRVHMDVDVSGVGQGHFSAVGDSDGTGMNGMGSVDDVPVLIFDDFGFLWIGPCTP